MNLQDAFAIESLKEKTTALRKLFAPYMPHVAVCSGQLILATVLES